MDPLAGGEGRGGRWERSVSSGDGGEPFTWQHGV